MPTAGTLKFQKSQIVLVSVCSSFHTVEPDIANDMETEVLRLMAGTFSVLATLLMERIVCGNVRILSVSLR